MLSRSAAGVVAVTFMNLILAGRAHKDSINAVALEPCLTMLLGAGPRNVLEYKNTIGVQKVPTKCLAEHMISLALDMCLQVVLWNSEAPVR